MSGVAGDRRGATRSSCYQPAIRRLLELFAMDVSYSRASGSYLYYRDEFDREIQVLDLVSGYGACLFGHNHPVLVQAAHDALSAGTANLAQGSCPEEAEALATALAQHADQDFHTVLANSGTEAVEVALKHSMLETKANDFVALEGAYHGKTLGALQATHNPAFRIPYGTSSVRFHHVPPNDLETFMDAIGSIPRCAGVLIEPIQGEGGVRPLTSDFARHLAHACHERNIPLIADECQTGVGRTGHFLASHKLGIAPDYVVLSKALGGGLAKVAATLIHRDRYQGSFELCHSSTYAGDGLSSHIARRVLELLDDDCLTTIRNRGQSYLRSLRKLKTRFPDVIADVRGQGLMLGLQFRTQLDSPSFLLRMLSGKSDLAQALAGYLFHQHQIRVATTLSDPWTIRLQPSLAFTKADWDKCLLALEDVCESVHLSEGFSLTNYVLGRDTEKDGQAAVSLRKQPQPVTFNGKPLQRSLSSGGSATRVAWLCHMIDADDLIQQEPELTSNDFQEVERYLSRWSPLASPVVMTAKDVYSANGQCACLIPILLPVTSRQMKNWLANRELDLCRSLIREGTNLAEQLNCDLLSLGQYTSIVTQAGRQVSTSVGVTTGNSYAVALAIEAIDRCCRQRGWACADLTLGIVGAAGNIGSICAQMLSPLFERVLLVGNGSGRTRLHRLQSRLTNAITVDSLESLRQADVVISAINAVDQPLGSQALARDAVICDLSVPASLSPQVVLMRPDLTVVRGGIARLPHNESLGIASLPLADGLAFACMAEGLLLALEGVRDRSYTGALTPRHITSISAIAQRHGFKLAESKMECSDGSERRDAFIQR